MTGPHETLRQITDQLLHSDNYPALLTACTELHGLCTELTGLDANSLEPTLATNSDLDCGRAISPRDAGRCIMDFARTVAFVRGVDAAVTELRRRFPNEPLDILYAGCGPFAPLIVTLLDRYSPDDLRITLLDIHQLSLDAAAGMLGDLGLADFIEGLVRDDPSVYRSPTTPDFVICAILSQALAEEPQVVVTANLASQVTDGGIFLPQRIMVDLCLVDPGPELGLTEMKADRIMLGRLLDLNAEAIQQGTPVDLTPVVVQLPDVELAKYQSLLLTTVEVFGPFVLRDRDSGITYPFRRNLRGLIAGDRLEFTYVTGDNPHFEHQRISDEP
jgi:hypothetical protein